MLEELANKPNHSDTQAKIVFGRSCQPWTDKEIAILKELAPGRVGRRMLLDRLPGRTLKAAKKQLSNIREELGIKRPSPSLKRRNERGAQFLSPDDPGCADDENRRWHRKAIISNARMVEALQRAMAA